MNSLFIYIYLKNISVINKFIYLNRWYIAIFILFLCITFKISGSSLGSWKYLCQNGIDSGLIIGVNKSVHADEYCVYTPMLISQFYNKISFLPYFGDVLRGTFTDMFIVYGQPVNDIAAIFRPFQLGYLFLGLERGLSFFWCSRLILLFMLTFEFAMIFTKKNKILSLACSLLITFSPVVQWWFSINSLIEMLIFGELLVLMTMCYLKSTSYFKKIILAFFMSICTCGYIFTFYPAWQIPLAYMFVTIIICLIIDNRADIHFNFKKDFFVLCFYFICVLTFLSYIYLKSENAILSLINTIYPGHRFSNGGGSCLDLFHYPFTLILGLTDIGIKMKINLWSIFTSIFDFFPIGFLMLFVLIFKEKKRNAFLIGLLVVWAFIFFYCSIGFTPLLSKITLMNHVISNRAFIVIGIVNVILLIYSMSFIKTKFNLSLSIIISTAFTYILTILSANKNIDYYNHYMLLIIVPILFLSFFMILRNMQIHFTILCVVISFFTGVLANPIRIGADVILKNKLIVAINDIAKNNEGSWFVEGLLFPMNNIPIMAGAPTINSTNVYPNLKLWEKIDPEKKHDNIYNRYGSFAILITNDNTNYAVLNQDYFVVYLNKNDVKKLGAKYILSSRDLSQFNDSSINFKIVNKIDEYKIFEIIQI
ncbi:MAG: hypothetical protein WCS83_03765 [Endomicrobiia bacterium]|nr:hypothetical protein [Endomicrobiaceae bacterium]MDD3052801.1 hypothetical protein [Endomicrobiaceae bacterium]